MGQSAIATKYLITAVTGTAGVTFDVAGRDEKQVLTWLQKVSGVYDLSSPKLTHSARAQGNDWKSLTVFRIPVMEALSGGDNLGYVATPKVAANTSFSLTAFRTGRMTDAIALVALDNFAYALLTDAKLRSSVIGTIIADAT